MRILFTGFDPFGGEKINPAGEAVKMMKNEIQGAEILKLEVPTVFGKAGEVLKKAVEQYRPDAVVCVGPVSYTHLSPAYCNSRRVFTAFCRPQRSRSTTSQIG